MKDTLTHHTFLALNLSVKTDDFLKVSSRPSSVLIILSDLSMESSTALMLFVVC